MDTLFYVTMPSRDFECAFNAGLSVATSFVLFFFPKEMDDDLSNLRDEFFSFPHKKKGAWRGMVGMHRYEFSTSGTCAVDLLKKTVLESNRRGTKCGLWQFALKFNDRVIFWFQDYSEAIFDSRHIPVPTSHVVSNFLFEDMML